MWNNLVHSNSELIDLMIWLSVCIMNIYVYFRWTIGWLLSPTSRRATWKHFCRERQRTLSRQTTAISTRRCRRLRTSCVCFRLTQATTSACQLHLTSPAVAARTEMPRILFRVLPVQIPVLIFHSIASSSFKWYYCNIITSTFRCHGVVEK